MNKRGNVWAEIAGYAALVILFVLVLGVVLFAELVERERLPGEFNKTMCMLKGCGENDTIIAATTLNVYYNCDCRYIKFVNEKNKACYETEDKAKQEGYERAECNFLQTFNLRFRS